MHDMFAQVLKTNSQAVLCHLCSMWYMMCTFDIAIRYNISLIIAGWTKGQVTQDYSLNCRYSPVYAEYRAMSHATKNFVLSNVRRMPQYKDFPDSMEEVIRRAQRKRKIIAISPHWFLPLTQDEYVRTIQEELQWKAPAKSYPAGSTNCDLNYLSVYLSMKHYQYTHYHIEMSKLIRDGLLTRDEALKALRINVDSLFLNTIARKLGCEIE